MPPLSPFCFADELADLGCAQFNQPSVLVAAGRAVLVAAGWMILAGRDPISPSSIVDLLPEPHRCRVCARIVYVCWVCVCVCAGFVPWVWFDWIVACGLVGFVDVGRWWWVVDPWVAVVCWCDCRGVIFAVVWLLPWCGGFACSVLEKRKTKRKREKKIEMMMLYMVNILLWCLYYFIVLKAKIDPLL